MNARGPRSPLDRLLAEVRAQRVPEPVESGLPARLRAEFQSAASDLLSAPSRARPAVRRWLPALALAAALAGLVLVRWAAVPEPSSPDVPIAALDGQALDVGGLVVAADQPRRVEHAGRASWVLAPGSQARILSRAGGVLRVSLEQGSLTAEVEPSRQTETFIVQAQGTEVAVHGTQFAVSVLGARVRVLVTRGQVQVRPVALGRVLLPTTGTLLGPGMQADFWAGASEPPAPAVPRLQPAAPSTPLAPLSARPARPRAAPSAPATASRSAAKSAVSPSGVPAGGVPAATAPSDAQSASAAAAAPAASVEQALETVTGHVQQCFREQLRGASELGIEAVTRLGLWVEPDGELLRAQFDPPLAPAVEACVVAQLAHLRMARSPAGFRVERDIRLRR